MVTRRRDTPRYECPNPEMGPKKPVTCPHRERSSPSLSNRRPGTPTRDLRVSVLGVGVEAFSSLISIAQTAPQCSFRHIHKSYRSSLRALLNDIRSHGGVGT